MLYFLSYLGFVNFGVSDCFVKWNVERFGEQTNFENIEAEKLGKFYAEAIPQHNKKGLIKCHHSRHQNRTKILLNPFDQPLIDIYKLNIVQAREF